MNSLLYYYNNVQKMAAYRQAKRMQRGVLTAQGEFSTTDPALLHVPCTIQCVFVPQTFESRQCVFDTRGSNASPRIDILENGRMSIYYSGTSKTIDISIGTLYNITFVTTETEQSVYVGGELLGSAPYSTPQFAYYVIGALTGRFMYRFKGDYLLHRHFNYAMSADEVKALDNNGDPMGYVVPKAMRELLSVNLIGSNSFTWDGSPRIFAGISYPIPAQNGTFDIVVYNERYVNNFPIYGGSDGDPNRHLTITVNSITSVGLLAEYLPQNLMESRKGPAVEPKAKIYEFNIGDEYYKSVLTQAKYPYDCIYRVDYVVDEWDCQPKPIGSVGFLGLTGATILTPDGQDWSTLEKAKVGESRTLLVKMPGSGTPALYIYGGNDDETATARHLKVTIKGITPVSVPISWLDSAKQLPLSDEYMEPLFQSIGGYDMAANGAPEILYNE